MKDYQRNGIIIFIMIIVLVGGFWFFTREPSLTGERDEEFKPTTTTTKPLLTEEAFITFARRALIEAYFIFQADQFEENISGNRYTGSFLADIRVHGSVDNSDNGVPTNFYSSFPSPVIRAYCYDLEKLGMHDNHYHGYVIIVISPSLITEFFVSLTDGIRSITDRTSIFFENNLVLFDDVALEKYGCPRVPGSLPSINRRS